MVIFLPLARYRAGDCSKRKWWRGECRSGGRTYRWQMRCCWSPAWECSSQSHRNTACPLGCTCIQKQYCSMSLLDAACMHHHNKLKQQKQNVSAVSQWHRYVAIQYRDHPNRGGAAQVRAMTQENAKPAMACFSSKRKLVIGLQITM